MKKNGFTLAEVLITLAIIGVVATLTLPSLMTNTGEQQYKTALKKGLNTLSEAGQMNSALEGFDYSTLTSDGTKDIYESTGELSQSLYGLLNARTKVNVVRGGWPSRGTATNIAVYFGDGTSIEYKASDTVNTDKQVKGLDGKSIGYTVLFDANGDKGPNLYSNCQGLRGNQDASKGTGGDCNQKDNRVIKDRFTIKLQDGHAVPVGDIARWAFVN